MEIQLTEKFKEKPKDETELGFGKLMTDHMFIMDYEEDKGWHSPRIVPYAPISIYPSAMCLHYGQTVFEGMKAYRREDDEIVLFRPRENFKRLNASCERLCIPKLDEEFCLKALKDLLKIEKDWVPKSRDTSLYIRPFIISTEAQLGVSPSKEYMFIIILSPSGSYYGGGINPVKIYVESNYVRAAKGGMGMAKTGGNYAVSLKSQVEAHDQDYSQVLWLDAKERKYVEEVGAMNIFFVIDGIVVTPDLNGSILSGITRMSAIELLKKDGYRVEERRISIEEIAKKYDQGLLEEVFGTGTAAVISPVGQLKWGDKIMTISDGKIGKISKYLYDSLTDIQWGRAKDRFNWIEKI